MNWRMHYWTKWRFLGEIMRSLENLQVCAAHVCTSNPLNDSTFTIQDLVQEKMTIQGAAEKDSLP